jgi:hypothetical protein
MRFGLFGGAKARHGDGDPARGFRDYVDTCVEAEATWIRFELPG